MDNLPNNKRFEEYHAASKEETIAAALALKKLALDYQLAAAGDGSMWAFVWEIADYLADRQTMDDEIINIEKRLASLFDAAAVKRVLNSFPPWLDAAGKNSANKKRVRPALPAGEEGDLRRMIAGLNLSPEWSEEIMGVLTNVPDKEKSSARSSLLALSKDLSDLNAQFGLVASFLRLKKDQAPHSLDELEKIFSGETEDFNLERVAYSLRFFLDDKQGLDCANLIYHHLRGPEIAEKEPYRWEDAFFLTVLLHFVFYYFRRFPGARQEFLLNFYLIKAAIAGVPVKKIIADELYYETDNVVDYSSLDMAIFRSMQENKEIIFIEEKSLTLSDIWKRYAVQVGEDETGDGYKREEFIEKITRGSRSRGLWQRVMRELLYVYGHLQTLDLVSNNIGGEPSEGEIFDHQLESLLTWWLDTDFWPLIAQYYADAKKRGVVPLSALFAEIKRNEDLKKPEVLEKIIKFDSFLKENNILSEEDYLIVYFEEDGAFHWNEKY